jgi:hypothetical protein
MDAMDEKKLLQWAAVLNEVSRLSDIWYGNCSIRIEEGKAIGLVEFRETLKLDMPYLNSKLAELSTKR